MYSVSCYKTLVYYNVHMFRYTMFTKHCLGSSHLQKKLEQLCRYTIAPSLYTSLYTSLSIILCIVQESSTALNN